MPSTGTPSASTSFGTTGASGAYTDAGPPERITPARFMRFAVASALRGGAISHHVFDSRTRRAISCAYCAPGSVVGMPGGSVDLSAGCGRNGNGVGMSTGPRGILVIDLGAQYAQLIARRV